MTKKTKRALLLAWGGLFILCAGLGFMRDPGAPGLLTTLAILFFAPGTALCALSYRGEDRKTLRLVRLLSAISLGATLAALILNFLTVKMPDWLGDLLYGVLIVVSSPMVCGQIWIISLFLWACLLLGSHSLLRKLDRR